VEVQADLLVQHNALGHFGGDFALVLLHIRQIWQRTKALAAAAQPK
jgi:hypothetical protein